MEKFSKTVAALVIGLVILLVLLISRELDRRKAEEDLKQQHYLRQMEESAREHNRQRLKELIPNYKE